MISRLIQYESYSGLDIAVSVGLYLAVAVAVVYWLVAGDGR